ncbi:MAG: hypothetical protein K9M94_13045 [Spirochaetia bacterium]|nr:hypothetical protein [Spirochaetia bacterium]
MKAKAKEKCFYKGKLYKEGESKDFPDSEKKNESFKEFFEVIDKPKGRPKSDSAGDSEPGTSETEG